jgi:hypothetical protein
MFSNLAKIAASGRLGQVQRLHDDEKLGPTAIAHQLGIGRASAYRLLGKQSANSSANLDGNAG